MSVFGGTSGFLRLDSWILANIVQLGTQRFCRKFLNRRNDPTGRQYDQMTQAARSGCANNAEGSARHKTSRETEMKLTDVARASLVELQGDYVNWLMQQGEVPWSKFSEESKAVHGIRLDRPEYSSDLLRDACFHILKQKLKFDQWLESEDDRIVANTLLILIARVVNMLNRQMESQHKMFSNEGGFREKLHTVRVEARGRRENAPECPECGSPMTTRRSERGEFWGCSAYPNCRGIRQKEKTSGSS